MVTPPKPIRKEPPKPGMAIPKKKTALLYDGPSSEGAAIKSANRRMRAASQNPGIAVRKSARFVKGS